MSPSPTANTYSLDLDALTVIYTDEHDEDHDLNATGEPCATRADLADFIRALFAEGTFGASVCDGLLTVLAEQAADSVGADRRFAAEVRS